MQRTAADRLAARQTGMPITTVFFDVGETLVDETGMWGRWADWLGVPRFTFFAVLGAVIARGEHHSRVFEVLRPGFDLAAARQARAAAGDADVFGADDFYADALPCLSALRARGYTIGIAGNQPAAAERMLRDAGVPADIVASSASWGVEKPSPAFFARIVEAAGVKPGQIAYVGDRADNDIAPAAEAGLTAVFLRRGPWALIHDTHPALARAHLRLNSLADLPDAIAGV